MLPRVPDRLTVRVDRTMPSRPHNFCNPGGKHVRAWKGYDAGRRHRRRCARVWASKATKPIELKSNRFSRIGHKAPAPNPPRLTCLDSEAYRAKRACFSIEANGPRDPRVRRSVNRVARRVRTSRGTLKQSPNVLLDHHEAAADGCCRLQMSARGLEPRATRRQRVWSPANRSTQGAEVTALKKFALVTTASELTHPTVPLTLDSMTDEPGTDRRKSLGGAVSAAGAFAIEATLPRAFGALPEHAAPDQKADVTLRIAPVSPKLVSHPCLRGKESAARALQRPVRLRLRRAPERARALRPGSPSGDALPRRRESGVRIH